MHTETIVQGVAGKDMWKNRFHRHKVMEESTKENENFLAQNAKKRTFCYFYERVSNYFWNSSISRLEDKRCSSAKCDFEVLPLWNFQNHHFCVSFNRESNAVHVLVSATYAFHSAFDRQLSYNFSPVNSLETSTQPTLAEQFVIVHFRSYSFSYKHRLQNSPYFYGNVFTKNDWDKCISLSIGGSI